MKKLLSTLAIAIFFSTASPSTEARDSLSVDFFYNNLSPHGNWLEVGDYGYCWQPNDMQDGWSPYSDGRWVYTDAGWTWDSWEPYGWAVYHYGRWADVQNVGWVWVPGVEWGPAWVSWRRSSSHVGWAPLPPEARFSVSIGFNSWVDSYYDIGPGHYRFVEGRNFGSPRLNTVFVDRSQNISIINQTTNITNITYENNVIHNGGPQYDEVVAQSSEPISRYKLDRRLGVDEMEGRQSAEQLEARVEGDTFSVAALPIEAGPAGKPEKIAKTVTDVEIDRGWRDAGSEKEVAETRKKMQEQTEVPAELPKAPVFVKASDEPVSPVVTTENPIGNGKGKGERGGEPATPDKPTRPMIPPVTAPGNTTPEQPARPERPEGKPGKRETTSPLPETSPGVPPTPRPVKGDKAPLPDKPLPGNPGSSPEGNPSDSQAPRSAEKERTPGPKLPAPGIPNTRPEGGPTEDPEPRSREKQPERTAPQRPEAGTENRKAPARPPQGEERARENAPNARPSTPPAGGNTEEELEKIKARN